MKLVPGRAWFCRAWFTEMVGRLGKCSRYAGLCFVVLTLMAVRAQGAVHPVPLDKNTDSAKCLECHEDK